MTFYLEIIDILVVLMPEIIKLEKETRTIIRVVLLSPYRFPKKYRISASNFLRHF